MLAYLAAATLLFASSPTALQGADLAQVYPATLADSDATEALDWDCTAEDVWRLRGFTFEVKKELKFKLRGATVVIGHKDKNALWAAILPDKPVKLSSSSRGDGDSIRCVWLRFHPSRIGELFPASEVQEQGDPALRAWGRYVFRHKIEGPWSEGSRPLLPPKDEVLIDFDTVDGKRRPFLVNLERGTLEYQSSLQAQMMPAEREVESKACGAVLTKAHAWLEQSYLPERPREGLDWKAVGRDYSRRKAETDLGLGLLVWSLLERLDDGELYVRVGEDRLPPFQGKRIYNGNPRGTEHVLGRVGRVGDIRVASTPDDVGYLRIDRLAEERFRADLDAAVERLAQTWSVVVDLRYCREGDLENAALVGGRFLSERTVYAIEEAADGTRTELACDSRGPWTYTAPVVVLIGRATVGPGEALAQMLRQAPGARLAGEPSARGSLGYGWVELGEGIAMYVPNGRYYDPAGQPLSGGGLEPDLAVDVPLDEFTSEEDPLLYRALEVLLETPLEERSPGKR
jgi:hypothetical protein